MIKSHSFNVTIGAEEHKVALEIHKLIEDAIKQAVRHRDDATVDVYKISQDDLRDENIRSLADRKHARNGGIEFDDGCAVSEGGDNGAYVQGWIWVSFEDTDLDKNNEEEEEDEK